MAERHKVPFTQKRAGESWESYGDRMALQVARLTKENQKLRKSVAEFLNYREHGKDYGTLTRLEGNLRATLASAEEKP